MPQLNMNLVAHRDGSFGCQHHMFWFRNKKIVFYYALLSILEALIFCLTAKSYASVGVKFQLVSLIPIGLYM